MQERLSDWAKTVRQLERGIVTPAEVRAACPGLTVEQESFLAEIETALAEADADSVPAGWDHL